MARITRAPSASRAVRHRAFADVRFKVVRRIFKTAHSVAAVRNAALRSGQHRTIAASCFQRTRITWRTHDGPPFPVVRWRR